MKLWGGAFDKEPDAAIEAFTGSLPFDQRMADQDVRGSIAHVRMLAHTGIIPKEDAAKIEGGLQEIRAELPQAGTLTDAEDIHSWVESRLREKVGAVSGKLHTARSRNDQVAMDSRLYLREAAESIDGQVHAMQGVLLEHARQHTETVLPGLTHLQHAQPVVLAHHLLAYFWMLQRDRTRLADWRKRANVLPLGAAALAGTPYPIDRTFVAAELGFEAVGENSLDNVSDRDFVIELASTLALVSMHLSRLAEEIAVWNTREYSYIRLDDSVATGSSIMPQKKNPDVAELVRGKTGRVFGNLQAVLTMMKGLPLAYNSDMQEDKERIFDSIDTVGACLGAMTLMLRSATFRTDRMRASTRGDFSTATDLADFLAQRGVPFRDAHEVVGAVIRWCGEQDRVLEDLSATELRAFHPKFDEAPEDITSVDASVRARRSPGGTAPDEVRKQLARAEEIWNSE
jgi:argininosuccinate lyase